MIFDGRSSTPVVEKQAGGGGGGGRGGEGGAKVKN